MYIVGTSNMTCVHVFSLLPFHLCLPELFMQNNVHQYVCGLIWVALVKRNLTEDVIIIT